MKLYIIFILHQTATTFQILKNEGGLYIIFILHQTATTSSHDANRRCCISSSSYIKPQRANVSYFVGKVVYHLHPTSNRNSRSWTISRVSVVYHLHPTSNRNENVITTFVKRLYIIFILHQTATGSPPLSPSARCISSSSYIKPQPRHQAGTRSEVVYHLHPTSNRNPNSLETLGAVLYIIFILHQTATYVAYPVDNH